MEHSFDENGFLAGCFSLVFRYLVVQRRHRQYRYDWLNVLPSEHGGDDDGDDYGDGGDTLHGGIVAAALPEIIILFTGASELIS